jgi:hypothetical protein
MGEAVHTEPPEDAIPADEAARIIVAGVPDQPRELWRMYAASPEKVEGYLQYLAAQRREAFASGDAEAVFRTPRGRR